MTPSDSSPILITGASGLVGRALTAELTRCLPHRPLRVLTRTPPNRARASELPVQAFGWDLEKREIQKGALEDVGTVIHLAGEPVAQRWTPEAKKRIRASRIDSLDLIRAACRDAGVAPHVISASAIGFYPPGDEAKTESMAGGSGFLADVVAEWEKSAGDLGHLGGGHTCLRIGLVLSTQGGALERLLPIYKWGLGAPLASGEQWQSWIHLEDLVALISEAVQNDDFHGTLNAVAPGPVRQREFSHALATALGRPHFFPAVPSWALRLWFGEAAEALLASHRILPEKLQALDFQFQHPDLHSALQDLVDRKK